LTIVVTTGAMRIADDDDLQAVRQRGAQNILLAGNFVSRLRGKK
jgi:ribosomal protein L30E